jgi:hypothetical protein
MRILALILFPTLIVLSVVLVLLPSPSFAESEPTTVKPLLHGLLDRDGPPPRALGGVVSSYVVSVDWKRLQPRSRTLRTSVLDRALAAARDHGARVKLRVLAGVSSPAWAKRRGGPPVRLRDPQSGRAGTVPRFWTPAFGRAYGALQRRLAARYDHDPVLAEVVISRCTTFYAEPFVRQASSARNRHALFDAGYTVAKDKACHRAEVDAHRAWARTRAGYALNPAQLVLHHGMRVDDRFTVAMMRYCRSRLGDRCVLENNSIRSPIRSLDAGGRAHYRKMYRAMARYGRPLAFQTATAERLGRCAKTLGWAADRGAAYVELPADPAGAGCTSRVLHAAARRLSD